MAKPSPPDPPAEVRSFVGHAARAVRILLRDGSIPRPLRWLAVVGLAPVPGPLDEAVLLLVALILLVFYRGRLRRAWRESEVIQTSAADQA